MDRRFNCNCLRIILPLFLCVFMYATAKLVAQEKLDSLPKWHELQKGISYWEPDAPEKSILNDSKIFILKADPRLCNFKMLSASEHGKQNRTADVWAKDFGVNVVVNAGMFDMTEYSGQTVQRFRCKVYN